MLGLILLSAALAIVSAEREWRRVFYVAKPLATLLIATQAVTQTIAPAQARTPLLAGLAFCLLGDIFLMLPGDRFKAGLFAFLLGLVAYAVAFSTRLSQVPPIPGLILVLALVSALAWTIRSRAGTMLLPMVVYASALSVTAWLAWGVWWATRSGEAAMGMAGTGLFLVSDASLALRRFQRSVRFGHGFTLATYYAAQTLIVLSFAP